MAIPIRKDSESPKGTSTTHDTVNETLNGVANPAACAL
jgi:hypothetical protein